MSIRDAAVHVLRNAGRALSAREITERMLSQGLWQTESKTPVQTVAARLYSDIKQHGQQSLFVKTGPNTFGLRGAAPAPAPPNTAEKPQGRYSFTDAAEQVLEQFGQKRPMHYRAITAKALELGWVATEGKTPEATMYAQILAEIRRWQQRGKQPRFVQYGRGLCGIVAMDGQGPSLPDRAAQQARTPKAL